MRKPANKGIFQIDPMHYSFDLFNTPMVKDIWKKKYRYKNEATIYDTFDRVSNAAFTRYRNAKQAGYRDLVKQAMCQGLFMPAGRILAGAGTNKRVTLMNCFVSMTIPDSMEGIMDALKQAALSMQQGGGIGMDFSTIRPKGALLHRTGSEASGPIYFMDMWNSMCSTIMSAGSRRGAMMGTMSDTHPDLIEFIQAKRTQGRLTNFNVSILVSDAFLEAIREDANWELFFHEKPAVREPGLEEHDFIDDNGVQQYVYSIHKARDLWELITRNTYEYSEPGVIFIDRINELNNLKYIENIRCTNPCGEQPLPPWGVCNLGHVNLSRMVSNPFTPNATFNYKLLENVTKVGIRFLDSIIDITNYPLEEQHQEQLAKRRIGLGISGLADALAQLGIRYGSSTAVRLTDDIMRRIAITAYSESCAMAEEDGPFGAYSRQFLEAPFLKKLPSELQDRIAKFGLRNGVLLTVAPTGTTSIAYGNISSGLEPIFAHSILRKVRRDKIDNHDAWDTYHEWGFSARFYRHCKKLPDTFQEWPAFMVTADALTVEQHIQMQGACQRWVDASVSKTVNIPKDMPYEEFVKVYELAYLYDCKGCTTYRPSEIRGSILSTEQSPSSEPKMKETKDRGDVLHGSTYRIRWPKMKSSVYVTINERNGKPYEIFFASKDARHSEWMTALTLMVSTLLRNGVDPLSITEELSQVVSMYDSAWVKGKFYGSLVACLADVLDKHFRGKLPEGDRPSSGEGENTSSGEDGGLAESQAVVMGDICPECNAPALVKETGCFSCKNCGYSKCG